MTVISLPSRVRASLLWALQFNAVMFIVARAMWKKRWFIKV